jgi:DNA topoisomerase-1
MLRGGDREPTTCDEGRMELSEYPCPSCGSPMVLRRGPRDSFLACSAYPKCRTVRAVDAEGRPVQPPDTGVRCDSCGSPMVVKPGPRGPFFACSTYPRCRGTKSIDAGA